MKSLFLVSLICLLVAGPAMSQTRRTKKSSQTSSKVRRTKKNVPRTPRTKKTVMPVAEKKVEDKSHSDKFLERLKVIYFSIYSSSPLSSWHADYAAWNTFTDTGKACPYNCDSIPQNIFNLLILVYNYAPNKSFVIQPRWSFYLGQQGNDPSAVVMEDWVASWGYRHKFNDEWSLDFRPGIRLPFSRGTRNTDDAALGDLTHQPDIQLLVNYNPNKEWSFQYILQNRFWIFEDRYNETRHRIAQTLNTNYQLTEKLQLQHYVEYWFQNDRRRESLNGKSVSYKNNFFNTYGGVSYMVTPKFGVTPLVGFYPNDPNLSWHSTYAQVWFLYLFK